MGVPSTRLDAADGAFDGRTGVIGRDEDTLAMELLPALPSRARDRQVRSRGRDIAQAVDRSTQLVRVGRVVRSRYLPRDLPLRLATPRPLDGTLASLVDDPDGGQDAGSDVLPSLFGQVIWDLDVDGKLLDLPELVFEVENLGPVDRSGFGLGGRERGVQLHEGDVTSADTRATGRLHRTETRG
jgi:hypothetical protein